ELKGVAQKSVDEGRSMDTAEQEQFDTLEGEIKSLDADIARFARLAAIESAEVDADKATAKPVTAQKAAATAVGGAHALMPAQAKNTQKLEPGIAFARAAKCLALAHLEHRNAVDIAKSLFGDREDIVAATQRMVTKS